YVLDLNTKLQAFDKALVFVRKNDETAKIEKQDNARDLALEALKRSVSVYTISENDSEKDAAKSLKTLISSFKNLSKLNYEAESHGIDKLVEDLRSDKYEPMTELLNLNRYVDRLEDNNN